MYSVAGIDTAPKKITREMSKKKQAKRLSVKPFVKAVNVNHFMPTRCAHISISGWVVSIYFPVLRAYCERGVLGPFPFSTAQGSPLHAWLPPPPAPVAAAQSSECFVHYLIHSMNSRLALCLFILNEIL